MGKACTHPQAILLLDSKSGNENGTIRNWFRNSRFDTFEASSPLDIIEEISDYTMRERPDVYLVEVDSFADELDSILEFVQPLDADHKIPVFAVATPGTCPELDDCVVGDLEKVKNCLDSIIPQSYSTAIM